MLTLIHIITHYTTSLTVKLHVIKLKPH